jgi:AmmeMemoRadiSam system protein B
LEIDEEICAELLDNDDPKHAFVPVDKDTDEEECCLEMQFPFIRKIFKDSVRIVPIYIGNISSQQESGYADILSDYFERDDCLFIFVTNLSHWGRKYAYTKHNSDEGEIFEGVEKLDKNAMQEIEKQDPQHFNSFLKETEMNMDGKNAISILLHMIDTSNYNLKTKFVRYSQSNHVTSKDDDSISYGSAIVFIDDGDFGL